MLVGNVLYNVYMYWGGGGGGGGCEVTSVCMCGEECAVYLGRGEGVK